MNKDSPHIWPAWCILQLTTYLGPRACVYACSRKTRDLLRICVDGWASASLSLLRLIGPAKTTRFGIEIGGMDSERVRKNVEGRKLMDYSGISQSDTIPHFLPYLSLFHEKVARNKQVQCVCVCVWSSEECNMSARQKRWHKYVKFSHEIKFTMCSNLIYSSFLQVRNWHQQPRSLYHISGGVFSELALQLDTLWYGM